MKRLAEWSSRRLFNYIHGNHLVYNTCWEDPRLDREAMRLGKSDEVLMITSAGCNTLDYLLDEPAHIHAVDVNHRQNALLDLKIAGIRSLGFDDFFEMFGTGRHARFESLYQEQLRPLLPDPSRLFWDAHTYFFRADGPGFYRFGTSGRFGRLFIAYLKSQGLYRHAMSMFDANSVDEQAWIFWKYVQPKLWSGWLRWCLRRETVHGMLGVPAAQRKHLEQSFSGGIVNFMENAVETVFTRLPLRDNYFWRVYVFGEYSRSCCPDYLTEEGFHRLKQGLVDRVTTHTGTLLEFLQQHGRPLNRFVLLDHMDWLWHAHPEVLSREWQLMVERSAPGAQFLWRSAGLQTDFVDEVPIVRKGDWNRLGELLTYDRETAANCHRRDRVHTYASFHIARLAA